LGTTSWLIRRVESGTVRVENAHGASPSIPFWNGEGVGRTVELSREVVAIRSGIDERDDAAATAWLVATCGLDTAGATQAVDYIRIGKQILGAVPTTTTVVAERFFDESGGMQLVLHTPFGARINRAWGLALRKKFCRAFNVELQAAATDNGLVLSLTEQHAFPLEIVFEYVKSASVEGTLTQALLGAPMFGARWRWNATRALAILRSRGGSKVPPQLQRMRADDLLAACFPDAAACAENVSGPIVIPDHVLVRETIDNCLHEAMDLDGLLTVLRGIETGAIRTVAVDTAEPSAFCHEILNANPYAYLDDAPLEERRTRAVTLRRTARADVDGNAVLDPAAIAAVSEESWPLVRDADELHDALLTLIVLPPVDAWRAWFDDLVAQRRATTLHAADATFWTCAERLELAARAYPGAAALPAIAAVPPAQPLPESRADAFREILRGWLESTGPATVAELAVRFGVDAGTIDVALIGLETEGQVLRGRFRGTAEEWCNRRVLARIHRLTLGALRREIEPVSTADYVRFLFRWQHVAPASRLHGIDGTLHVIRQLEGYELPAAAWEASVLPARVAGYKRVYLDRLCYAGDVMWGRLSPHPALTGASTAPGERPRRIRPTKLAPIALFAREHAGDLIVRTAACDTAALSHAARDVLDEIARRGAPFFADIVRGTNRLPAEVEEALWQLVAAGLVTADGFDALRALTDSKRRLGEKGVRARPRSSGGRWSRLDGAAERIDADAFARRLLARWGIVFRDVIARESLSPPWREVLAALRRMEARGEIRGGRFVAGYIGEQFALPDAIDALRASRRSAGDEAPVDVTAYDPLQLVKTLMPGAPPRPLRSVS
jgi:ATP-dependent Lhr-like helicase